MTNTPSYDPGDDDHRPDTGRNRSYSDDPDDYQPNELDAYPGQKAHDPFLSRQTLLILLSATVISLAVIAAVLAAAAYIQTDRSQPKDPLFQALAQELAALSQRVDQIETAPTPLQNTQPTPTPEPLQDEVLPRPTPTPQPTSEPTPSPGPTEDPPPTGTGICGRSPHIQTAILQALGASSCRSVTTDELYRVTRFVPATIDIGNGLHLGDFAGLVNVKTLSIDAGENFKLRAGSLEGLTGLHTLNLTLHPHGTIEPGTFLGLPGLKHLSITANRVTHEPGLQFSVPPLDQMPNLRSLIITTHRWMPDLRSNHLSKLPSLLQIEIRGRSQAGVYPLPPGLFQDNLKLEEIRIRAEGAAIRAPAGIFAHLDRLQWLYLEHFHSEGNRPTFSLSPVSPLMIDILHGEQQLWSYLVVPPDGHELPQND